MLPGTRFSRYINIIADEQAHTSWAMQNQKKFQNLFIIIILTDILTSTYCDYFGILMGVFKLL